MNEAVRTTASPAAIWVIVVVMSIMTAILVSAAAVADSWQARATRRARGFDRLRPAVADAFTRGAALSQDAAEAKTGGGEGTPGQGPLAPETVPAPRSEAGWQARPGPGAAQTSWSETDTAAEAPTRPDLPPVPGRAAMPAQRSGDSDRAEQSPAGTGAQADDDPGRR
jgi:hypothetical protein